MVTPLDILTRPASADDVLDVSAAAARLGLPVEEAHTWLEATGLIRRVAGHERVVWGEVLDSLRPPRIEPRPWSESDVLSVAKTVKRMAMNEQAARTWLARRGLVRSLGTTKRVIWGDVLGAMRDVSRPQDPPPRPSLSRPLPRSKQLQSLLGK